MISFLNTKQQGMQQNICEIPSNPKHTINITHHAPTHCGSSVPEILSLKNETKFPKKSASFTNKYIDPLT